MTLHGLVERLRERGGIGERVLDVFATVPRQLFLPGVPLEQVYDDEAIVTKRDAYGVPTSSSSQPAIMAIMLEQLGLEPGMRVLEIGAGTGYNAALMSRLVGPSGQVVSVDLDADLVETAAAHLAAAGVGGVRLVCGDGAAGYEADAPYDRMIATVGVWDLAPAWLEQLAPGGRLVVPLDLRGVQVSVALERADGHWTSTSVVPCGFMRMRGSLAGPEVVRTLDVNPSLLLFLAEVREVGDVLDALDGPVAEAPLPFPLDQRTFAAALSLWLATHDDRWCTLTEAGEGRLSAPPVQSPGFSMTAGLARDGSLALLSRSDARGYGPAGAQLAEELVAHVMRWREAGRPTTEQLRVDAHPGLVVSEGLAIVKRHTTIVLTWLSG